MTRAGRLPLVGLTVAVAVACAALGLWQRGRLLQRRAANALILERRVRPPVDLSLAAVGTDLDQRRVTARGSYDHERTFVLRNRVERETPGVFLATPLRLEGRPEAVLVLRGFVPAQDALRPDGGSIERPASAAVEGIALPVPISADSGGRLEARGTVTWRRLDLNSLQRELPYPVLEVFVHATRDSGFEPRTHPWPVVASLPPLNDGPHLSYMIQWFGIGAVALGFGIAFVRRPG